MNIGAHQIDVLYNKDYFHGYSIELLALTRNNYDVGYIFLLVDEQNGHVLVRRFFADHAAARRAYNVVANKEPFITSIQEAVKAFFEHMAEQRSA